MLEHVQANVRQLEDFELSRPAFEWPAGSKQQLDSQTITLKANFRGDGFPENEKSFFHYVLARRLIPRSACLDPATNRTWAILNRSGSDSIGSVLGRLLLWERKKAWCDCDCNWTQHYVLANNKAAQDRRSSQGLLVSK